MTQGETDPFGKTGDKNWDAMIAADRAAQAGDWAELNPEEPVEKVLRMLGEEEEARRNHLETLLKEGVKGKTGLVFVDNAHYQGWFPADTVPGMQEPDTVALPSISSPAKINEPHMTKIPELFDKNRYDQRDPANTPDAYGRFDEAQLRFIPSLPDARNTY